MSMGLRFPSPAWAWPRGRQELLIVAAGCPNEARAAGALLQWLDTGDLNDATFAEQRLLARAAVRFPASRLDIPERGRIDGIVRMLWSKSRIALKAAEPVLQALSEAGVEMLVIKGAAFSALDMKNLKGRVAHDVDLVIRPHDYPIVLDVLDVAGWRPDHGTSTLYLKSLGPRFHALNFVKAPNGDIDIHSRVYRTVTRAHPAEAGIWQRARDLDFLGARVKVPSATDRFTIALAHGTVDALHHADWIVDCVRLIEAGEVDWALFLESAGALAILPHAHIALTYMVERLHVCVPDNVLETLRRECRAPGPGYLEALFLFHARDGHSRLSGLGRRIFKARHIRRIRATNAAEPGGTSRRTRRMRRVNAVSADFGSTVPALVQRIALRQGQSRFRLVVDFGEAVVARRYYLEINTSDRHLMRLKFRDFLGRGRVLARIEVALPDDVDLSDVWATSRPAGALPVWPAPEEVRALGAVPIRVAAQ